MKILKNESLAKYTTVHIGGIAKTMYIPENRDELLQIIKDVGSDYIIGGGSNLLINNREFDHVINLREFDKNVVEKGNGEYYVGASVRLQTLIRQINKDGYGGIEYLYSVPGLLGGAVVMNAGGGVQQGWSISDHVLSVTALYNGEIIELDKEKCNFSHRHSIFKDNSEYIVLGAYMKFDEGNPEEYQNACKKRLAFCKQYQDNTKPNFGSVFRVFNPYIMEAIRRFSCTKGKGVHFSKKTANWIINEGGGSFSQADRQIKKVMRIHRLLRKECFPEVIIWR